LLTPLASYKTLSYYLLTLLLQAYKASAASLPNSFSSFKPLLLLFPTLYLHARPNFLLS
jgi:hypothetical protein